VPKKNGEPTAAEKRAAEDAAERSDVSPEDQADHAAGITHLERADGLPGTGDAQAQADEEAEQGFRGEKVDPEPNESYTVAGQVEAMGNTPAPVVGGSKTKEGE
jgi:hypothetical protein